MAQVKWTPQALDDLEAICLFIARDAPQIAAVFADRAFRATDRLANFPRSGRIVPEPKQETYSAVAFVRAQTGPTQWVAYHIGGKPGQ